ncbi:MAG: SCO family protein [Candidatus Caldarchaeum sp.]
MKDKKLLVAPLSAILLASFLLFFFSQAGDGVGAAGGDYIASGRPLPGFSLKNTRGEVVSLDSFRGKVVLVFLGYTSCPDVCPMALKKYAEVERLLGNRADEVVMLFITTDPQRDTPSTLEKFVAGFSPNIVALTGTWEELAAVWKKYHARPLEQASEGSYVTHSAVIYVGDRSLVLRKILTPEMPAEEMAREIKKLI